MSRGLMGRQGRGAERIQGVRVGPDRPHANQVPSYNETTNQLEYVDPATGGDIAVTDELTGNVNPATGLHFENEIVEDMGGGVAAVRGYEEVATEDDLPDASERPLGYRVYALSASSEPAARTLDDDYTMVGTDRDLTMDAVTSKTITLIAATAGAAILDGDDVPVRFWFSNINAGTLTLQCAGVDFIADGGSEPDSLDVLSGESITLVGVLRADATTYAWKVV